MTKVQLALRANSRVSGGNCTYHCNKPEKEHYLKLEHLLKVFHGIINLALDAIVIENII
jgi:hypothetical protein